MGARLCSGFIAILADKDNDATRAGDGEHGLQLEGVLPEHPEEPMRGLLHAGEIIVLNFAV